MTSRPDQPRLDQPSRDTPLVRLAVLTLLALAARAMAFGSPVVHVDEPFYLTVAHAMTRGALPYVDMWDRKPVGLFLLYLPAAWWPLPAALYVYQAMAAAAAVATAYLVTRVADRAGWPAGALAAGVFYLLWLDLADGQGGQSPVFYNLPMALAAWLGLGAASGRGRWRGAAAMLLVGTALQIKYSVVFEGVGLGLWLLTAERRRGKTWASIAGYAALLVGAALLPTALVVAVYAGLGHFGDFVFANFVSIGLRGRDSSDLLLIHARDAAVILSPLLLTLAGGGEAASDDERRVRRFVRWWLAVALLGFVAFGGWYNHYALPVMLPGAIVLAGFLRRRAGSVWWAAVPLLVVAIAGQVILSSERARRGTAAEFDALAARVGRGDGGLFVYSGPVLLYPATGRPALTRYLFPSHLEFAREAGSIGIDQADEIARIFARRPDTVVMAPPISEERPAIRALVLRLLAAGGYRAGPPLRLGSDLVIVYRRPVTSRSSPPAGR